VWPFIDVFFCLSFTFEYNGFQKDRYVSFNPRNRYVHRSTTPMIRVKKKVKKKHFKLALLLRQSRIDITKWMLFRASFALDTALRRSSI
jgi:hypothetical protein